MIISHDRNFCTKRLVPPFHYGDAYSAQALKRISSSLLLSRMHTSKELWMQETSYDAITVLAPLEESCGQSGAILYGTTMGNVGAIPMKTIHKALECAGAHTSPLELDEESTVLTMAGGVVGIGALGCGKIIWLGDQPGTAPGCFDIGKGGGLEEEELWGHLQPNAFAGPAAEKMHNHFLDVHPLDAHLCMTTAHAYSVVAGRASLWDVRQHQRAHSFGFQSLHCARFWTCNRTLEHAVLYGDADGGVGALDLRFLPPCVPGPRPQQLPLLLLPPAVGGCKNVWTNIKVSEDGTGILHISSNNPSAADECRVDGSNTMHTLLTRLYDIQSNELLWESKETYSTHGLAYETMLASANPVLCQGPSYACDVGRRSRHRQYTLITGDHEGKSYLVEISSRPTLAGGGNRPSSVVHDQNKREAADHRDGELPTDPMQLASGLLPPKRRTSLKRRRSQVGTGLGGSSSSDDGSSGAFPRSSSSTAYNGNRRRLLKRKRHHQSGSNSSSGGDARDSRLSVSGGGEGSGDEGGRGSSTRHSSSSTAVAGHRHPRQQGFGPRGGGAGGARCWIPGGGGGVFCARRRPLHAHDGAAVTAACRADGGAVLVTGDAGGGLAARSARHRHPALSSSSASCASSSGGEESAGEEGDGGGSRSTTARRRRRRRNM